MSKFLIFMLEKYQKYISPIFSYYGVKCKYFPSCSEYSKQAIRKYGSIKGLFLTVKRICKCNPFSKGGYDPVK